MAEPVADVDVPGWWTALGIPGLFDVHVHFLPPPILRRVREHFDNAGPLIGRAGAYQVRLIDTPPSASSAVPVVKLDASEAR